MKSRGKLQGLQFISYAKLSRDILEWSRRFPLGHYRGIVGIPRSGLTVAHMLSVHLNAPCVQLHSRHFRQSTGRRLDAGLGPYLIVDDTSSYGTAIIEAKQQLAGIPAEYAAVYARDVAKPHLDHWYTRHEEPDWLVITEWNWFRHQDREYIAVTDDVESLGFRLVGGFDAVYHRGQNVIREFKRSDAVVLFTLNHCQWVADSSGKPVIDAGTMQIYEPRIA